MTDQLKWRTDNINLAAYLVYLGHEVLAIEWEGGGGYFVFRKTKDLLHASVDWIGDEAVVNPKLFSQTFGQLKTRLFDEHPNPPVRTRY